MFSSFHPLHRLRRSKSLRGFNRALSAALDIDWLAKDQMLDKPFYVSLSRNTRLAVRTESYEPAERASFRQLLRDRAPELVFDIGANVGLYAWETITVCPAATVVMCEPDERNVALLKRSILCWGAERLVLHEGVVSDRDADIKFAVDEVTGLTGTLALEDSFVAKQYGVDPETRLVQSTTVDAMAQDYGSPDVIKMDVEQAELMVLRGARETLSDAKPVLFFECTSHHEDIASLLGDHGYVLWDARTASRIVVPSFLSIAIANG